MTDDQYAALHKPRFAEGTVHSPINLAVLGFLREHGPAAVEAIYEAIKATPGYTDGPRRYRLRRMLNKMRSKGLAHGVESDDDELMRWAYGAQPKPAAPEAWQIVQPRVVNVMHGPTYVPRPGPVLRPGAEQFLRVRSHGVGC